MKASSPIDLFVKAEALRCRAVNFNKKTREVLGCKRLKDYEPTPELDKMETGRPTRWGSVPSLNIPNLGFPSSYPGPGGGPFSK